MAGCEGERGGRYKGKGKRGTRKTCNRGGGHYEAVYFVSGVGEGIERHVFELTKDLLRGVYGV